MYHFRAPAVYVSETVHKDPKSVARMDRMMKFIDTDKVITVTDAEMNDYAEREGLVPSGRTGQIPKASTDPSRSVFFDTYRWRTDDEQRQLEEKYPALYLLWFLRPWMFRDKDHLRQNCGGVCQSAWELHCAEGCLHGCRYCFIGNIVTIKLDLENYIEPLRELVDSAPKSMKLFKYDNRSDQICFEPEYGASDLMVRFFASTPGRYLLLYTKSDNVDHLLDLPHNGHTVVNWSISSEYVSQTVECFAPPTSKRIQAAEKCQRAGYPVRARISPTVPTRNWRKEYAAMIGKYLSRVKPDVITFDVLGWMTGVQMVSSLDIDDFDPEFRDYAKGILAQGDPVRGIPYNPHGKHFFEPELRAKVYRHLIDEIRQHRSEQRITICMETPEMWQAFGPELGMSPDNYVCCCGPTSVPGNKLLS